MSEKKRGRPVKETVRNRVLRVRVSDEEMDILDTIAEKTRMSKSNIIRAALILYYSMRCQ